MFFSHVKRIPTPISSHYPDQILRRLSNQTGIDESEKSDSSILRCSVKGIIFAISNAKIILEKYPIKHALSIIVIKKERLSLES